MSSETGPSHSKSVGLTSRTPGEKDPSSVSGPRPPYLGLSGTAAQACLNLSPPTLCAPEAPAPLPAAHSSLALGGVNGDDRAEPHGSPPRTGMKIRVTPSWGSTICKDSGLPTSEGMSCRHVREPVLTRHPWVSESYHTIKPMSASARARQQVGSIQHVCWTHTRTSVSLSVPSAAVTVSWEREAASNTTCDSGEPLQGRLDSYRLRVTHAGRLQNPELVLSPQTLCQVCQDRLEGRAGGTFPAKAPSASPEPGRTATEMAVPCPGVDQWFSKCGPWTRHFGFTCEYFKISNSWALPQPSESDSLRVRSIQVREPLVSYQGHGWIVFDGCPGPGTCRL